MPQSKDGDRSSLLMASADALIAKVREELDAGDAFYRENGLDRETLAAQVGAEEKEALARLLAEDMAAVAREVNNERERLSQNISSHGARKGSLRNTV